MRFDVGDRVLVHQQLVDSQQMHDAQQVCELVRAYVRPAGYDRPSMPTCPHTYLLRRTIAAWRRPMCPPTPPACSPIGSREARGAARSNDPRPLGPCASAGRVQWLWASRHARERRLGGPATASALELVASIEPLLAIHHPDGRTLLGVHPVAHPGGAPPACSRSTSSRSPTPCGTKTTAGSTTASTTAAWRRPMVSAPAPPPVAPPCSPRPSSGAGATARCNLPPCRACRARHHLRRCRRPDLSRRTLAASSPQCAWSATQARRGPTSRAHPWFLVAGG